MLVLDILQASVQYNNIGIASEPNRRRLRVWNSHGHVTTLPMAIPDAEMSVVRFFAVCCG